MNGHEYEFTQADLDEIDQLVKKWTAEYDYTTQTVFIRDRTPTAQVIPVETWQEWPETPVYELPSWAYAYLGVLLGFVAVWWFT